MDIHQLHLQKEHTIEIIKVMRKKINQFLMFILFTNLTLSYSQDSGILETHYFNQGASFRLYCDIAGSTYSYNIYTFSPSTTNIENLTFNGSNNEEIKLNLITDDDVIIVNGQTITPNIQNSPTITINQLNNGVESKVSTTHATARFSKPVIYGYNTNVDICYDSGDITLSTNSNLKLYYQLINGPWTELPANIQNQQVYNILNQTTFTLNQIPNFPQNYSGQIRFKGNYRQGIYFGLPPIETSYESNIVIYDVKPCPPNLISPPTLVNNICSNSNAGSATFTFDRDIANGEYFVMNIINVTNPLTPIVVSSPQVTQLPFNLTRQYTKNDLPPGTYFLNYQTFLNNPLIPTSTANSPNFTITAPPPVTFSQSNQNILCKGAATGSITVNATGGSGSFEYSKEGNASWQNSNVFSSLSAGTYQILVKDSNGCIAPAGEQTVTLTEPATTTSFIANIIAPTENNVNNGQISVTASGGTFPLTYNWVNTANPSVSIGTTNSINALFAGSYSLTTTDANLCTKSETFTLTNPPLLVPTLSLVTPVRCNGESTAKLLVTIAGGVPNTTSPFYTVSWKKNGNTIFAPFPEYDNVINLGVGFYEVSVTDANNVSKTATYNITQPNILSATGIATPVNCFGGTNGTIDLTVSGGTAPYTYLWSNGATTEDLFNLSAGFYSCVVKDARGGTYNFTSGCSFTTPNIQVTEPQFPLSITEVITPITTAGSSTGGIIVTTSGGTPNYSYLWSPGGETTASISGKPAGNYSVVITDSKGCTIPKSYTLNDPTPLSVSLTQTGIIFCDGANNGVAQATTSGGQGPFSYQWKKNGVAFSPISSQIVTTATQQTLSNLVPANYQVTVTGTPVNTGNTTTSSVLTIGQLNAISIVPSITDVNCFSGLTGAINISVSGGTAPFTYEWFKNSNPTLFADSQNITGLTFGNYTVYITDVNKCVKNFTLNVSQPTSALSASATSINPSSFGGSNGSINATISGGTAPYSYSWTNGAITEDLVNVIAGFYTLTVTDAKGCTAKVSKTLTQPDKLQGNLTSTTILCNGGTASLTINTSGGISPYTYIWKKGNTLLSGPNSTTTINNQAAGSYTVTINDNATPSNQIIKTLAVTQPDLLSATATQMNTTCFDASNGSINLTILGGTSPFTTPWKNGVGTVIAVIEDPSGLPAGVYSCFITDVNGCTFPLNGITIGSPLAITSSINITNPITASGASTGSLSTTVSGGTAPYSYLWNNGVITTSLTNIPAGNYNVAIIDSNGCTGTASIVLNDLPVLTVSISQTQNISCFQGSNGKLVANPSGGNNSNYTYVWKKGGNIITNQTTQFLNNIGAGSYQVIVTDGYGNTVSSAFFTVTEPTAITATTQITNATCFGTSTGSIAVNPSGGTGFYTYKWFNGSQISTAPNLQNVASGTYSVWIYDTNNCGPLIINNLTISQPALALSVSLATTNVTGFGLSNGAIASTISGGTAPYNYSWNSGQTSQNLTAIPSGNYTLTVTDSNGCQVVSNTIFISQPTQLKTTISLTTAILCNGNSNGSLTANPLGGSGNYTYLWSNGATSQTIIGLASGTYSVVVKDNNQNQITASYNLMQPISLTANYATTPILCNAAGSLTINVLGGTAPYSYLWNTGAITPTISVPSFSIFNCAVTDSNGCAITLNNIQPTQTSTLTISPTVIYTPILISGGTGGINISVSGGTSPYSYLWSNGATTQDLVNVVAGSYAVTVTDASGCTQVGTYTLSPPIPLSVTISQQNFILCNGGLNAQITANPLGGQPIYSFVWKKNGTAIVPAQNNAILNGISVGNYQVVVTDANNSSVSSAIFVVSQPNLISANTNITNVNCFGGNTGGISLSVIGGTLPYAFLWKNSLGATISTSQNLQNVTSGVYSVIINDANNCSPLTLNNITITQPNQALSVGFQNTNPTGFGLSNGAINATILGGTAPYTYSWNSGQVSEDLSSIIAGNYTLTVTDNKGCQANLSTTLSQPNAMQTNILVVNPISCNGDSNGSLIANVIGGVSPYSYLWKKGAANIGTNQNINNLNTANYTLIVTDANGNQTTNNYSFLQPNVLTATYASTPILCNNGSGGSLTLIPNGGTAPYNYQWNTGQTSATLNNVIAGNYVGEITDSKGCSFSLLGMQITQPSPIVMTSLITPILISGTNTGAIVVTISGGVTPYTYSWNSGDTNKDIQNKPAGIYTLVATDSNGCTKTGTYTIIQTSVLSTTISTVKALECFGDATGILNATPTGGQAPFTFVWKKNGNATAANTQQINNLSAGNYQVIITDSAGAIFTSPIFVLTQPVELISNYLVASQTYKNEDIILINVSNNANETYNWIVPNEASIVSITPQTIIMKFNQTGGYSVGLQTTNTIGCQSVTNKQIIVEENLAAPNSSSTTNLVKTFSVFPNPLSNNGTFFVKVILNQQNPISLTIYEAVLGSLLNQIDMPSATEHLQDYNLNLSSGVYWVILRTAAGVQAKKVIVN